MTIKDYAITERHYPGLCPDYEPFSICQATELHNQNTSRHRVIENSLKQKTESLMTEGSQMNQ